MPLLQKKLEVRILSALWWLSSMFNEMALFYGEFSYINLQNIHAVRGFSRHSFEVGLNARLTKKVKKEKRKKKVNK
jgi:hypothetical protein